jgi:acyl-CoA thioester hydrolase
MLPIHSFPIRVYYEDTDAGGIMYHASHVRFLERGRTEFLRELGVHHSALMDRDPGAAILFIVRRMEIDYLKPARLDDLLTVTTELVELGAASLKLQQTLLRGEDAICRGLLTIVTIGPDGRPKRLPSDIRVKFTS